MTNEIIVSICCQTFNHVNYIQEAIESFLMQKTNFPFEILLRDDASTDGTTEIVKEYVEKYPHLIKPLIYKENQFVKGVKPFADNVKRAQGKYIALCEGDDYWTDPLKLQKQVDFLETHSDYALCFHNAIILWDNQLQPPRYFCPKDQKHTSTTTDVINKWFIPTASMVFRKEYITPLPQWYKEIHSGDWALQLLLSDQGKIGYLSDLMSVYRRGLNPDSMYNTYKNKEYIIYQKQIELLNYFNEYTHFRYNQTIQEKIMKTKKIVKNFQLKASHPVLYYILNPKVMLRNIRLHLFPKI